MFVLDFQRRELSVSTEIVKLALLGACRHGPRFGGISWLCISAADCLWASGNIATISCLSMFEISYFDLGFIARWATFITHVRDAFEPTRQATQRGKRAAE